MTTSSFPFRGSDAGIYQVMTRTVGGGLVSLHGAIGAPFTMTSVALSARQAAGLDPVLAANSFRSALMIVPPNPCYLAFESGQTVGLPLLGGQHNPFAGAICPTNDLYIVGAAAGDVVVIASA